jgi:predicted DNA repair protein MutK
MSAGLFGLLDDVATLAKLAAASLDDLGAAAGKATTKAAGVVIDDTAVTPQYVHGIAAHRELPIIRRIAVGSLRNKLLIILPVALLLSELLPGLLAPILMLGGTYLAFEGAEKIGERLAHGPHGHAHDQAAGAAPEAPDEDSVIRSAVRTDLILSAEIMVIALDSVSDEGFWARLAILVVVALVITIAVYGVVAVIVKMDDLGLALAERGRGGVARFGAGLVTAMPRVLAVIGAVGTVAMLWVGGHILLAQAAEVGWHAPYDAVHHLEHAVRHGVDVDVLGPVLGWCVNTAVSAVVGLVVGAVVAVVVTLVVHRLPLGVGRTTAAERADH